MMDLSKPLQEDIKNNQIYLKTAIKNHQALVLKLRANFDDPTEIKQKLADIQKHIINLGDAQKVLVARVRKEIADKSWNNNNNNSINDGSYPFSDHVNSLRPSTANTDNKLSNEFHLSSETDHRGKRKRENEDNDDENDDDNDDDDDDENDDEDEDEEVTSLSPSVAKRNKPMLSVVRPATPVSSQHFQRNESPATSSDDSQESGVVENKDPSTCDISKEQFMGLLNLITKDTLSLLVSKNKERRRRRLAGHHSLYTSHWDLTVQRRTRTRLERDAERHHDFEREDSPIGSPPIVEIKKANDSSSDSGSPSPTPLNMLRDDSYNKSVCIICRKQGILSVCDSCSSTYHWSCLDKLKTCPQCQARQINPDSQNNSRSVSPCPGDDAVSKVLGDVSKPPTRVSSKEVIERYFNRSTNSADETNTYEERLKVKKKLQVKNTTLKTDLKMLEEKAAQLSASLVASV